MKPTPLTFRSGFKPLSGELPEFAQDVVKNEPMLFSCDTNHAARLGGPITQAFLDLLLTHWGDYPDDLVWDSRVHMLMPGWFPCIPGWHLDDIPRTRSDGQPDHVTPAYRAEHVMAIVGDASRTVFAVGDVTLDDVPEGSGKVIYGEWHHDLERLVETQKLATVEVPERVLIQFNDQSFHRGAAATKNGWRWFVRVTRKSQRPILNELRRQVQVYMGAPNNGW